MNKTVQGIWSVSLWLLSLLFVWLVLAQHSFLYAQWYQLLNIDQTIEEYAPQNRFGRHNFTLTDDDERERLFAEIVVAIHQEGNGLSSIEYRLPDNTTTPLLTNNEILHLQDVASLIAVLTIVMKGVAIVFMASSFFLRQKNSVIAPLYKHWQYAGFLLLLLVTASMIFGVKNIFYWLHTLIFPKEHPWFFYYQDSLMSTLMQAPVIFLPIMLVLLSGTFLLWSVVLMFYRRLL
ncbi:lipoprotein intramolecular transacylase Lit [Eionea flava]